MDSRALLLALLLYPTLATAAPSRHDPALESRIESLLADMLGPGKAHIFVEDKSIPLNTGSEALQPWSLWKRLERSMTRGPGLLPGYPAPLNFREELARARHEAFPRRSYKTAHKVILVLDSGLSPSQVQEAQRIAAEVISLDPKQGDTIGILRAPLRGGTSTPTKPHSSTSQLLLGLAAGLLLLGLMAWRVSKRGQASDLSLALISRRHAQIIADFLQRLSPRAAARALGALRRPLAVEVFLRMPPERQLSIAEILARGLENTRAIGGWVSRLEAHIAAYLSGPGLLEDILLHCPEWTKELVLARLNAAIPQVARALRESLPTLEHVAEGSRENVELCLSPFSCEELALCLYDAPSSQVERILGALPQSVADKVRARLKFFVPDSLERAERMRAELCARWRALQSRARVYVPMRLAPLTLLLFAWGLSSGCVVPAPAPKKGLAAYDRPESTDSSARLQALYRELGLPNPRLEAELYKAAGGQEARDAMQSYANRSDLKAVLLAQAALGEDPDNETRRLLLKVLAERTGIEPEPDGVLPRAALLQHELRKADDAFYDARFGAAIQACRRAMELDPDNSGAWLRLGSAYFALGQREQARSAYSQALKLNPKDSELKEFLLEQGWLSKK